MHSFTCCHLHIVFATKERRPFLAPALQQRLWPYLGGIARENKMKALAIGGVEDHVHMLVTLPATLSVAKAVQVLKGNSSKWIHETFSEMRDFAWQEGYGAFGIGVAGVDDTIVYIRKQPEHHRWTTFQEELAAFLKKHGMAHDAGQLGD
jgi:REP element-mobilizing transposase RayT